MKVPFFRPAIDQNEIDEVVACLKSGWLTTGPRAKQFEKDFAEYTGFKHAVALNSATAGLHLALESVGVRRGDGVLVPTMTFAATAEVVRYFEAVPVLVDCRPDNFNIDVEDAHRRAEKATRDGLNLKAVMPVHYGGQVADVPGIRALAGKYGLRIIEDAAHCCPAYYREEGSVDWKMVGSESDVSCFSFYANKCITTGEGGMSCTNDDALAERMRVMSLHGISKDAWKRYAAGGSWYYEIIAPGFKYNLTDIASAIGIHQLRKANAFLDARCHIAALYRHLLEDITELILPTEGRNRRHAWHLYPIRLDTSTLKIDRAAVIEKLTERGIGTSVHWMPLHMHPYYRTTYSYREEEFPVAAELYKQQISLPIFPGITDEEVAFVANSLRSILASSRR